MRFSASKVKDLLPDFILVSIAIFPLVSLIVFAYLGTFTRYISDDYFSAASLQEFGYWGAQAYWWMNWTGRYSFIALILFIDLVGASIYPVLPGLFLLFWLLSLSQAAYQLLSNDFPRKAIVSIALASMVTWIPLRSLVQYPEVVFWKTGICNYAISPILYSAFIGFFLRRTQNGSPVHVWEMLGVLFFSLAAGGFSETGVAAQIALLGGAYYFILIGSIKPKKNALSLIHPALAGSVLALVIMSLSPGNLVRAGNLDNVLQVPDLWPRFSLSFSQALWFIPNWIVGRTTLAGLAFLFGMSVHSINGGKHPLTIRKNIKLTIEISLYIFLGIWAAISPSFLIRGFAPPERALLVPTFLITCLAVFWGWIAASSLESFVKAIHSYLPQLIIVGLVYTLLLFGPVATITANAKLIPTLRLYATMWDERDRAIKNAVARGDINLVVTSFQKHRDLQRLDRSSLWIVGDLEEDPEYWINQGAAWYYGLDTLTAK